MKKLVFSILAGCLTVSLWGGVPLAWTNSPAMPPRMLPPIPHGSAIEFAVTLSGYTTPPVADGADVRLWYQTNGMGRSWWSAPATLTGNVIRASFGAAQDTGADRVSLFFGAPSNVFASAVLRLTPSPGFAPNSQAVPASTLDFSRVEVANAPWPAEIAAAANAATNYTDEATAAALDAFSATGAVARAETYGTATRWTDATGCVWQVRDVWRASGYTSAYALTTNEGLYTPSGAYSWSIVPASESGYLAETLGHSLRYDFGQGAWVVGVYPIDDDMPNHYEIAGAPTDTLIRTGRSENFVRMSETNLVGRVALSGEVSRSSQSATNYTDSATALTPVYSEWVVYRNGVDVTYYAGQPIFYNGFWDVNHVMISGDVLSYVDLGVDDADATLLMWFAGPTGGGGLGSINYTATRQLLGYTLGSHGDTPLASTNAVAAATRAVSSLSSRVAVAAQSATNYTDSTAQALYPKTSGETLAAQVAAIGADLNAENAHFVSTNYDSVTTIPEAYVEIKMSNTWIRIWSEMTRWNRFVGDGFSWQAWQGLQAWSTNVDAQLSAKAAAEYAFYDGVTGEAAPDGYFWVGQPRVAIAAGMSYQRYVSSGAAVWVLESNGTVADVNGTTNGFFRITDDEGNSQFEIVKGSSRTVAAVPGAMSSSIVMGVTHWQTAYSVTNATSAPVAKFCRDLRSGEWYAEGDSSCPCNVSWSASGAGVYSCEWWPKSTELQMFMKAEYGSGSETRIVQSAPVELQHIVIGGVKYAIGTATISGSTVLTLSPATP